MQLGPQTYQSDIDDHDDHDDGDGDAGGDINDEDDDDDEDGDVYANDFVDTGCDGVVRCEMLMIQ